MTVAKISTNHIRNTQSSHRALSAVGGIQNHATRNEFTLPARECLPQHVVGRGRSRGSLLSKGNYQLRTTNYELKVRKKANSVRHFVCGW